MYSIPRLFGVAACVGFVGGLGEVALLTLLRHGFNRPAWLGHHVVWMAPLMAATITAVLGVIPALLVRVRRPDLSLPVTFGFSAFVATWGLLILLPRLHEKALLIPAAGVGYQAYRFAIRRPLGVWPLARRVGLWCAVLVVALGVGLIGYERWVERALIDRLPEARPGSLNVLLLVMDTQRAASMSLYGYRRKTTPELEAFAAGGTVFDRAVSVSSWTLPGHIGFFTGRYPHQETASWRRPLSGEPATLAEILASRGYATAGFVANTFYTQREFGLARGFQHYEDYVVSLEEIFLNSSLGRRMAESRVVRRVLRHYDTVARRNAADINRQLLRWLDRRPDHPFLAFVNYYDVHEEYLPPPPFDDLYGTRNDRRFASIDHRLRHSRLPWRRLPPQAVRAEQDAYDGAIAYLDREIGRLLTELARRRLLENTLVIVTSDHGEEFGEHGQFAHGNTLYTQAIHVPLILRAPGLIPEGKRIATAVSLRDLPATILEITGTADRTPIPGGSLSRYWVPGRDTAGGSPVFSRLVDSEQEMQNSLVLGGHHYLRWVRRDREALFDLDADPEERKDLAAEPTFAPLMATMRRLVDSIVADSILPADPRGRAERTLGGLGEGVVRLGPRR